MKAPVERVKPAAVAAASPHAPAAASVAATAPAAAAPAAQGAARMPAAAAVTARSAAAAPATASNAAGTAALATARLPPAAAGPATTPAVPAGGDRVFNPAELPADVQGALPKLAITGGVYSENAAQRMLVVGGQVVNEGAELAPGVVLDQIRSRSAVLRFRGYRYAVSY
jgi:general secretion pathway protein B